MHLKLGIVGLFLIGFLSIGVVRSQDDEDVVEDDIMMEDEGDQAAEEESQPELKIARPEYKLPKAGGSVYFEEPFESLDTYRKRWVQSDAKKDDGDADISKYDGIWSLDEAEGNPLEGDLGLMLKSKAKHHAISAKLTRPFDFKRKPFIVQYEVRFVNGQECGGAYVKLLTQDGKRQLNKFYDKTPYTIMFGPDKCGQDNKLHFIFRHKSPVTGEYEEKHAKKPSGSFDKVFTDKKTHLFTLVIQPDNTFEILVDQDMVNSGSLLTDMTPPVNPPKEITDPEDKRPEDWDEREKIPDPDAVKPEDWDEDAPEMIPDESATMPAGWLEDEEELVPDPDAEKPADWDEDMDGSWEPPMISNPVCESSPGCGQWVAPQIKNPLYKGKWRAPLIDNPNYKGKWTPRKIPNPNYFEDKEPFKMSSIDAIGLELWSMSEDIVFDNFIIGDDKSIIDQWTADTWEIKHVQELAGSSSGRSVVDAVMDATNERPWLWAVFIVVVVLPIILIIVYCCMPSGGSKEGIIAYLSDSASERPWLYGVYVVVALLPVVLLSVWLCPNSGPGSVKKSETSQSSKKTDEPTPDDPSEDDNTQSTEGTEAEAEKPAQKSPKKSKKASKADLEDKEEEAEEGDVEDDEEAEAEEEEAGGDNPQSAARTSPRKRKPRARRD